MFRGVRALGCVGVLCCAVVAQERPGDVAANSPDPSGPTVGHAGLSAALGGYSEEEAVELAYISTAAYCEGIEEAWDCGEACAAVQGMEDVRVVSEPAVDAHAFVGRRRGQCILAFRGTDSAAGLKEDVKDNFLVDLPGCSFHGRTCQVGKGFLEQYSSIAVRIKEHLQDIGCSTSVPLAVTGHSLGGALTALALFDLSSGGQNLSRAYTFGQPRVGDDSFAGALKEALTTVPYFRVTRADDPFVHSPSGNSFLHTGVEVFYPGDTAQGFRLCGSYSEEPTCSGGVSRARVLFLTLSCAFPNHCGHFLYLHSEKTGLLSHASCQAARRLGPSIVLS